MAHLGVDQHATAAQGLGDKGIRRDIVHFEDGVEGIERVHVQVEMVCENAVGRGLREDVDVGDLKVARECEIHNADEL